MRSYAPSCNGLLTGVQVSVALATPQLVVKYTMHSPMPINGEVSCSRRSHDTTRRITPQLKYHINKYNSHSSTTNNMTSPMSSRTKQTTHETSYGSGSEMK